MPKSEFSKKEEEILKFWKENQVFEKSVDSRPENKPYVFYDGPPFATGLPHYGHILASTVKDVFPRYFTMRGYRVERRWGWDCHGLPIENIAEKELGIKTKKQIEEFGVEKFNEFCRSKVLAYASEWKGTIERLGRWADMDNAYKTMDLNYMETVWWVFKELFDKDLIYKGRRSMHVCPRCETTLSQSEVAEGYKDINDLSVTVKFHLKPGQKFGNYETKDSAYVLAWTTTPWTLIGNVALAVGTDLVYSAVRINGELLILARDRIEDVLADKKFEIVHSKIKGSDLIGLKYEPLFDYQWQTWKESAKKKDLSMEDLIGKGLRVLAADFVSTEEGTGIVHIAPAFGEDDLMLIRREKNLPLIQHVGMDGLIKEGYGEFSGLSVKPADDMRATDQKVIQYLKDRKLWFYDEEYTHSYPHCWRCETPLINYATSSWFVAVEKVKDRAIELVKEINWMPKHIKEGRFGKWLEGARDWSISRQRYWASVIPIWICDKSPEHKIVIGSVEELEKLSGQKVEDLHKHVVDKLEFACDKCDGRMKRVPDVLDTWFDSGSMPYAQMHYPFENKEKFEANFPAEFIGEGVDQTRAWFYYLHVLATAIVGKPAFKNVAVNGIILAEDGKKMSKRLKNYPDPSEVFDNYGADALRFYLMNSVVMQADNLFFSEKDLREAYNKVINPSYNVLKFYQIYAKDTIVKDSNFNGEGDLSVLDKWVLSKLASLLHDCGSGLNNYDTIVPSRAIRTFVEDLSTWWVRRSRERFKDEASRNSCLALLKFVLENYAKVIAPFTPFLAEEVWKAVKPQGGPISVHLSNWPEGIDKYKNEKLEEDMYLARRIVEKAHAIRATNRVRVRQPLARIFWNKKFSGDEKIFEKIILDELNIENYTSDGSIGKKEKDGDLEVAVDLNIDERLLELGDLRELMRAIQQLRKSAGLKPGEKAQAVYSSESDQVNKLVAHNLEKIKKSASLSSFDILGSLPDDANSVHLSGGDLYFQINETA